MKSEELLEGHEEFLREKAKQAVLQLFIEQGLQEFYTYDDDIDDICDRETIDSMWRNLMTEIGSYTFGKEIKKGMLERIKKESPESYKALYRQGKFSI